METEEASNVTKVFVDMSMSLDGYIVGPNDDPENPLGDDGERFHEWLFDLASFREMHGQEGGKTNRDDELFAESIERAGANVMGRRMFSNEEGLWGEDPFEGHWSEAPQFHGPVFVLTHHPRKPLEMDSGTTFHFVTDGIETALERARTAMRISSKTGTSTSTVHSKPANVTGASKPTRRPATRRTTCRTVTRTSSLPATRSWAPTPFSPPVMAGVAT
ncbi:hypothetical protein GCM10009000_059300 [Halobacterium noricense]